MNGVRLKQLSIFLEIYRRNSISIAAERLNLTQAATSIALRQLESELGGKLFNRTTRRLTPTNLAEQLAPIAERMLEDARRIAALAVSPDSSARVAIACTPTFSACFLPGLLRHVNRSLPSVHLDILDVTQVQFIPAITSGQADFGLGFIGFEDPELRQLKLLEDHLCFVTARDKALATQEVTWHKIQNRPLAMIARGYGIRTMIEQASTQAGVRLNVTHEVNLLSTALALTSAGLTNTIAPSEMVRASGIRHLFACKLKAPVIKRDISAVLNRHATLSYWAQKVLDECVVFYAGLAQGEAPR